ARGKTLFGDRRGIDPALRRRLREWRGRVREIRQLRRQLQRDGAVPWFHYECHFGDVMARGGFDLVLGNPPWVRAEDLPLRLRDGLRRRFRCWKGSGHGFAHQPDLSVAFIERGIELLTPGGTLGMLVPAKLASARYGTRLRTALTEHATLHLVADLR